MKTFSYLNWSVLLFLFFLTGCINVDQRIKINEDGSGTINLHYWTKSSYLSNGQMDMGDDIAGYSFLDEEIKNKYNSPVTEITNMKRYKVQKDSMTHIELTISFKDFNRLSEAKGFSKVTTEWKKGDDGFNFKYDLARDTTIQKRYIQGDERLNYSFEFPYEVISCNGAKEGNSARWTKTVTELADGNIDMTALVKGRNKICGIIGFELPLILIAGLFFSGRKINKK